MKKGFGYYLIMVFLSATGLVLAFVVLQFALFFVITREKPKAYTFPDSKRKTYFAKRMLDFYQSQEHFLIFLFAY